MPKYMIIIAAVVIIIIFSTVRLAVKSSNHHFKCPECGESFQVKFLKFMFTAHSLDGKSSVTCPNCGKTNMLASISGKK